MLKDYYKILELPPTASISDVKKKFRKLALRYHPDTNQGNRYAEAWYREIQEAYETLTDDNLRNEYLQQRWLLKSQGKPFSDTVPLTPPFILKHAQELKEQVKHIDHFRMDHLGLQQQILSVVTDERIDVLNTYQDEEITREVMRDILACLSPLEFPLLKPITRQLHKIQTPDHSFAKEIDSYYQKRKRQYIWERYQALVILAITIILCLLIYLAS